MSPWVFDAPSDTLLRLADEGVTLAHAGGHVDLSRLRAGGVGAQVFACWVEPAFKPARALARTLHLIDTFWREVERLRPALVPILTREDLQSVPQAGRVGALLSLEGGEALEGDEGVLRCLFRLGLRAVGLTWNERNLLADGVGDAASGGGLSALGRRMVAEMNRLGVMVDVSHLSERGFYDVAEVSTRPFIASHSNARAVADHPRNLRDGQIRTLAQAGGVMGLNLYPPFLRSGPGTATLEDVVRHVDHVAALVGCQVLALGSDFDGIAETPIDLPDCAAWPALTEALLRRGYRDEEVAGILGENLRRVFLEVLPDGPAAGR